MLQEQGRVVSVEAGAVWVQTRRKSTCSSCSARAGCGHALLDKLKNTQQCAYIRAGCDAPVQIGDQVVIGVPEQAVVQGSMLVYLCPLLALMLGIWLGSWAGLSEPMMALAGAALMALAFFSVYRFCGRRTAQEALQPRVLSSTATEQVVVVK